MKVAVLLSGGVDSSVALHLAKAEAGRDLTAFYLKIWLEDELAFLGECPWEEDLSYVRAVCDQADVPLQIVSLQSEYQEKVVEHVVSELKQGRTPSPDILCNQFVKFGLFFDKIDPAYGRVVSGHYAQIEAREGRSVLKRSPDLVKDQTYFLSRLNQRQLSRIWFPIGHLTKPEVRKLAQALELPNRERKDSQGICFLGKIKYPEFVRFHLGERTGEIVDCESGRKLGEHRGVWFHTVGQRSGLRLGGGPWYVVKKDPGSNTLFVSHASRYLEHAQSRFVVGDVHWILDEPTTLELTTKVRHSPHLAGCTIRPLGERRWEVCLSETGQGIAPGQSAVFYDGEVCLGAGVIEEPKSS